jgi:putative flippase GtrA
MENRLMKKLFAQLIKFGFVGGLCFLIDFAISTILFDLLNGTMSATAATAVGGFFGFTVSVIINYLLSMKFVFERKEDMSRKKEFVIFVILSIIGLGLNEIILVVCRGIYSGNEGLNAFVGDTLWFAISKIIATAVVMIYNFVSRKIFLEKKG